MNLDELTDKLKDLLGGWLHSDWMGTFLTVVICIAITALISHLITKIIRQWFQRGTSPLPSSSIFINIARVIVWVIGISVILSTCFKINVSGAVTALGVGGIAISLGFQATLSNLIGGLQLSLTGLVKPGDHIEVSSHRGIVKDVTWRHTSIITTRGENVIIPNSVINSEALIKLLPQNSVRIGVLVDPVDTTLSELTKTIEKAVDKAVGAMTVMEQPAKVQFSEVTDRGYKGLLSFAVAEGANVGDVKNVALKAISEYASKTSAPKVPAGKISLRDFEENKHKQEYFAAEAAVNGKGAKSTPKGAKGESKSTKPKQSAKKAKNVKSADKKVGRDTGIPPQTTGTDVQEGTQTAADAPAQSASQDTADASTPADVQEVTSES